MCNIPAWSSWICVCRTCNCLSAASSLLCGRSKDTILSNLPQTTSGALFRARGNELHFGRWVAVVAWGGGLVAAGGTGQNAHQRLFWENIVPLESHAPPVCFFQQRVELYKCDSVFRSKATIQSVCHHRSAGADVSRKDGIKWHVAGECRLFPLHLGPSNDYLK